MRGPLVAAAGVALVAAGVVIGATLWRTPGIQDPGSGIRRRHPRRR